MPYCTRQLTLWLALCGAAFSTRPVVAADLQPAAGPVSAQPDGLLVCEAEEFRVAESPDSTWQAKKWGENLYAATFANCFLSRKAFLGAAPEASGQATIQVQVPAAGRYLALVRYEAAYRFETQFRLRIEQGGKTVFDRRYGARDNLKIWAFGQKLKKEVGWSWGAVENIVWEGHDAFVALQPGIATLTLIAEQQPAPAAPRNIDLVMLTTDVDEVQRRIEKENYLPLDGLLTQSGDVWLRVTNRGAQPLVFSSGKAPSGGNWQEHSPYWVHLRNWKPVSVAAAPGQTSDWVEVGGLMDSLNDGQWSWHADGAYRAEFAVRNAAQEYQTIAAFSGDAGPLVLAGDADTRRSRRLRTLDQVLFDLLKDLKQAPAAPAPTRTPIYASTFEPLAAPGHAAAVGEFQRLFGISSPTAEAGPARGYIDVRGVPTPKLEEHCRMLGAAANGIAVVSLGDEIQLPAPQADEATHAAFRQWLQSQRLKPQDLDAAAGADWSRITYQPGADKDKLPALFYWSTRYRQHAGIQGVKQRTEILRKHLPKAAVGANFSPHYPTEHMFLGEVYKWATVFRDQGMTLPWSEDYIWQVPIGSPQMNHINLDLFRAGLRGQSKPEVMYYVMPHAPNNTPRMWRRLFYGAVGHGMTMVNLFEFRPVQVAYTENHVDDPAMYRMVLQSFRELAKFEGIVQDGRVREGQVALWFSETGDVWGDNHGSFAPAKRALYTALRHQQTPLDFLIEPDVDKVLAQYKVLYLTDRHVSQAASQKIAAWVRGGGRLVLTAGAAARDELNRPNTLMLELAGVAEQELVAPPDQQVTFIKQDLPFARPIAAIAGEQGATTPVFGVRTRLQPSSDTAVLEKFDDGGPAVLQREVGQGRVVSLAFLPGLSYYHPAVPLRPVDRGATDDAMIHFLPTTFDRRVGQWLSAPAAETIRPVICSEPLVESTVIDAPQGMLIPLVNWTGRPLTRLRVEIAIPAALAGKSVVLASGGALDVQREAERIVVELDLDAADAIIVR